MLTMPFEIIDGYRCLDNKWMDAPTAVTDNNGLR